MLVYYTVLDDASATTTALYCAGYAVLQQLLSRDLVDTSLIYRYFLHLSRSENQCRPTEITREYSTKIINVGLYITDRGDETRHEFRRLALSCIV